MEATTALQESQIQSRLITDNEISLHDLITAHLEEMLREEDAEVFDGLPDSKNNNDPGNSARWFPFKNKMELVGSMLIGHTHSLISRAIYNKVRAVMSICDIKLPAWATVRSAQVRVRKLLQTQLKTAPSPFGTPCFSLSIQGILLQDLANPLVSRHIDYYPEMTSQGHFKFSQSKKWLEELAPQHRAPMCEVNGENYYLYEPVELASGLLLIPIYFYIQDSQLVSKCIAPDLEPFVKNHQNLIKMKIPQDIEFNHPQLLVIPASEFKNCYCKIQFNGQNLSKICGDAIFECDGQNNQTKQKLPNPWRKRAEGKVI
ncbi:hypothetical protein PTTG_30050 [Puccinia triticina 1-1 BBBD Race 1]|uniref:Uncharacterized protein n=1 Tax=Puccinia triticina (isolate 1-1 / race 1 (BBBD)) TaxID=630390 RepID=A0A180G139_PUCT1|nr:hypothetical protein PTTG_30050 [Puccinia triticina 1-1 BBBD Race 1]